MTPEHMCTGDAMDTTESIEAALADEHRNVGYALLHGKTYDNKIIVDLHQRLTALADIENARTQEAREESAKAHQAEITAAQREAEDLTAASAKALAESRAAYH